MKTKKTKKELIKNAVTKVKKESRKLNKGVDKYRKERAQKLFKTGLRLYKLNEKETAIKDLKKAYLINPKNNKELTKEKIAFKIAEIYSSMNDYHNELKYYNIAIRCKSDFFDAWFKKGIRYLDLGIKRAYNDPEPPKGRLGRSLKNLKKICKEALFCFKNAEKAEPKNAKAPYYAGMVYELLNNPKEAIEMFDRVLELDNNFVNIEDSDLFGKVKNESKKSLIKCSKCNSKIKEGDKFCPDCGNKIK